MDTNDIIVTVEVTEATEEIATAGLEKGLKMAVGIGLAMLAGGIAYKYIVKPIVAKIKDKNNQQVIDAEAVELEDTEIDDESDEDK